VAPGTPRERFERFLFEHDDALMGLRAQVTGFGRPELLPLDLGPASLDRLEAALTLVLDGRVAVDDRDVFATRVGRYLGEVLRHSAGGRWELCTRRRQVAEGCPGSSISRGCPASGGARCWWCSTTGTGAGPDCSEAR
jgi:hypothetical protein